MTIRSLLVAISGLLALAPLCVTAAVTPEESVRIDTYIATFYKKVNVVKRTSNGRGEIISCVDLTQQPGLAHPLATGTLQMEPSPQLKALLPGPVKPAPLSQLCPRGSLEMRLPTRDEIAARGSLKKFLSKDGRGGVPSTPSSPSFNGHSYGAVGAGASAMAAKSTFNIWNPALASSNDWFSLSQIWVAGGSGAATQTAEVGAQVAPFNYYSTSTNLFIYFTADNYATTGCYNLDCAAFVQTSDILPIGGPLPTSAYDGAQAEGTVAWYRDPANGNWILFMQNWDGSYTQSGYYPASLYGTGQLSQNATLIEFGGEVSTNDEFPILQMGSGNNPNSTTPLIGRVAYQRNLQWMHTSGQIYDFVPSFSVREPNTGATAGCAYNVTTYPATTPYQSGWGTSIFFGGAGYGSC